MKAVITLTDQADGGFTLGLVHEGGYTPSSQAHVASYRILELMDELAKKRGDVVKNITHQVTVASQADCDIRQRQADEIYDWLGRHFGEIPLAAIESLREILGPPSKAGAPADTEPSRIIS